MNYLFLDASQTPAFGQAGAGDRFQTFSWTTRMNLASRLREMAEEMAGALGFPWARADRLGVCTGPGSLTGLRVAISFFRAMALAAPFPMLGIDLFTWSAHTLMDRGVSGPVRLIAPAFLNQVFLTDLTLPLSAAGPDSHPPEPVLGPRGPAADGRPTFGIRCMAESTTHLAPDPGVLHRLMTSGTAVTGPEGLLRVTPLYVVPSQAEMNWSKKHDHAGN